jgi:hypothetical protein
LCVKLIMWRHYHFKQHLGRRKAAQHSPAAHVAVATVFDVQLTLLHALHLHSLAPPLWARTHLPDLLGKSRAVPGGVRQVQVSGSQGPLVGTRRIFRQFAGLKPNPSKWQCLVPPVLRDGYPLGKNALGANVADTHR